MSGAQSNNQGTKIYFLGQKPTLQPSVQYNLLNVTKHYSDPKSKASALKPKKGQGCGEGFSGEQMQQVHLGTPDYRAPRLPF